MRHKGVDKQATRQKMLEAASCCFRKHGYAGIGVDGLSKAAGVTSGAFYSHFGSKDGAFNLALAAGLDEVIIGVPRFQNEHGTEWVKVFTDYYLGQQHMADLETGCAMAALTPEVVRFGAEVHQAFEEKMTLIAELVAQGLSGESPEDCLARAWSMLAVLIGGLNIARAMQSAQASKTVAEAIKVAVINAAGETGVVELA
ncbi:TetR/AcrR family transcriptional regulator [Alteromonadaceae bacterium BrNp21-10]|nr:TetR/AcrR family transcriptional regulator [Alteromonadaceae bacterium BrNp21-10]